MVIIALSFCEYDATGLAHLSGQVGPFLFAAPLSMDGKRATAFSIHLKADTIITILRRHFFFIAAEIFQIRNNTPQMWIVDVLVDVLVDALKVYRIAVGFIFVRKD